MSLNELAAQQEITGQEIQRLAINYKKDSVTRKTEQYLAARLKSLEQLWDDFEATDNKIRISHGQQLDHDYFVKGYYEGIRAGYYEVREDILQRMKNVGVIEGNQPNQKQPQQDQIQESRNSGNNDASTSARGSEHQQDGNIRHKAYVMQGLRRLLTKHSLSTTLQSVNSYELMIKAINAQWEQIQDLHRKLVDQAGEAYLLEHMEDYLQLEDQTRDKLLLLHEGLSQCQRQSSATTVSIPTEGVRSAIKLPKIELPKFDGDYLKWRQFYDLYTELVHNQSISAGQKLWYLKGSLSGEAEKLIRHLTVSDANYATAWKLICDRYENKRLLVTALLSKLLAQPAVTTESASAIKILHDTTQECLLALSNLGIDITNWDPIILHILIRKLDRTTHTLWEQSLSQPRSLQSLQECLEFLENRFQSLEALGNKVDNKRLPTQRALASTVNSGCPSCNGNHPLFACKKLLQLSPSKRVSLIKNTKACFNCLKMGHNLSNCTSRGCSKCGKRHNTLLHIETTSRSQTQPLDPKTTQAQPPQSTTDTDQGISLTTKASATRNYVLLSTVSVKVTNKHGTSIECRAILDCGSQLNFISERLVKKLGLTGTPEILNIEGIGSGKQKAQKRVNILLESRINGFSTRLEAHVLPRIISPQPSQEIDISTWEIPANIQLADPRFNQPDNIDLLIGAGLYYSTLSVGQIKLGDSLPVLQNTVFGWTAAGTVHHAQESQASCGICSEEEDFKLQIEKFWALDDAETASRAFTAAERRCEQHFVQTTRRTDTGRFVVRLPFKDDPNKLGDSKNIAYHRLLAIERKLSIREDLRNQYISFMEEYSKLGHMREINFNKVQAPYSFLPHHCVIKPESTTTKLRVVFDASAKTSSNISVNDLLYTGPTIQDDVFAILLRFRMPRFVFTADIEKMYRQIEVHPDDRKYQLIWWRNSPSDRLRCYELCTVTYGTTSAPYLAVRCLKMLAEQQADQYPLGTEVLKQDFYVDDVLTGADKLTVAIEKQAQLQSLLQSAGFKLRKWCANHPSLLKNIPREDQELQLDVGSKSDEHIKTMGLIWRPKNDDLCIKAAGIFNHRVTKRTAYSEIAQLFDPLGIIGPVVVTAKIFLQKLWLLKCDWDAALPQELQSFWLNFREGLKELNNVKIPRHVFAHKIPRLTQIHVFADASERAYGAAAYVRSIDNDHIIAVRLLGAKSRVAPIKQTTLPRLELCAAKLAAELAHRLKKDLNIKNSPTYLWTDSEIVLSWINASSSSYQTFVANRISSIQQLSIPEQWRHVRSKENPADVLSRGLMPEKLGKCNLWLYGPTFLHGSEDLWPPAYAKKSIENDTERRRKAVAGASVNAEAKTLLEGIDHKNSFRKVQRIIAYALRFIKGSRKQSSRSPDTLVVNTHELKEAQVVIVRLMQQEDFKDDLAYLQRQENVMPGTMVLIKEDNLPPLKWMLGRIINVIKGEDDLVRVVDVRTANGISRRPIHKLAPLPVNPERSDNEYKRPREESPEESVNSITTDRNATESIEGNSREHSPRKVQRISLGAAMVSLLLTCLVMPVAKAAEIEITPFSHQPGIYFENLGAANIISNEWDLVVYYDLAPYWKEYEFLQNYTTSLKMLCRKIEDNQACRGIVSHLAHLLSELTTNNILLSSSNNQKRRKRGALNFVGNVANALFGVLDSEYAEKMTQTIAEIKGNENHALELMKNQTSVLDATLNIMQREEEAISHQFHQLQANIDQVTKQINGIMAELYQEKLAQTFITATLSVILTATNFLRIQTSILDVIADIHHGRISPLLVAPQQLKEELVKIKTHLPSSLQLPLQRNEPIKYYSLMRVQGRITNRYAIFKLIIPLLSTEEFELFKVTPVPVRLNDSYVAIKPSSPFLMINLHRDQYYPVTEQELQACIIIEEGKHLCNQNHPIYRKGSSVSECEINYMNHAPPSSTCQIIRVEDGPHWIQLYTANEWIYVLSNETTINVVCGDKISQQVIQGTGILKIRDRCIIRQPLVTIQGHNIYPSIMRASYIPLSNLTDMNIANRSDFTLNHTVEYQSYVAEIETLKQEVQQLRMHTSTSVQLPAHEIHQFSIGYVSLVLIVVIGVTLLWKYQTKICPVQRVWKPAPAPRQQNNSAPNVEPAFNIRFDV